MKILFTGAASFTGLWFVKTLASRGHQLICPLRGRVSGCDDLKQKRLSLIREVAEVVEEAAFGSARFLSLGNSFSFDCICHHGSEVKDYRSPSFEVGAALSSNTFNLPRVLDMFESTPIVLTGSIFEQDEGLCEDKCGAFSPYGLSKGLTYQYFRYYCDSRKLPLLKFVVPNPFGPHEDRKFTAYLMNSWKENRPVQVKTPDYIRDNIPIDFLSIRYADYVEKLGSQEKELPSRVGPSGYAGTQRDFVDRVAKETSTRTGWACAYEFIKQADFSEPLKRINLEQPFENSNEWDESRFWDNFITYYQQNDS